MNTRVSSRGLSTVALLVELSFYALVVDPLALACVFSGAALLALRFLGRRGRPLEGRLARFLDVAAGGGTWAATLVLWASGGVGVTLHLFLPLYALAGAWYLVGRPRDATVSLLYGGAVGLVGVILLGLAGSTGLAEMLGTVVVTGILLLAFARAREEAEDPLPPVGRRVGIWTGALLLVLLIAAFLVGRHAPLELGGGEDASPGEVASRGGPGLIGFTDRIDLGRLGELKSDDRLALQAIVRTVGGDQWKHETGGRVRPPLLLAGTHLDAFDGRGFYRSGPDPLPDPETSFGGRRLVDQRFLLATHGTRTLFALHRVVSGGEGTVIEGGELHAAENGAPIKEYRVRSAVLWPGERRRLEGHAVRHPDPRYGDLPPGWPPPRIRALAEEVAYAPGASDYTRVRAVESWLRRRGDFVYSRRNRNAGPSPLETFLFRTRSGHCEFYAAAMVVLLRSLDLPARVVVGFRGGTYSERHGRYNVLQKNAHAWVEVPFEDAGWIPFDPTPAESRLDVTRARGGGETTEEGEAVGGFEAGPSPEGGEAEGSWTRFVLPGLTLLGGVFVLFFVARRFRAPHETAVPADAPVDDLRGRMRAWLGRRGGPSRPPLTLRETFEATPLPMPPERDAARSAVQALDRLRFAPRGERHRDEAVTALRRVTGGGRGRRRKDGSEGRGRHLP